MVTNKDLIGLSHPSIRTINNIKTRKWPHKKIFRSRTPSTYNIPFVETKNDTKTRKT